MADDADRAQAAADAAQQRFERDRLQRIALSHAPRDPELDKLCVDCGGDIEPDRLRTLHFTMRCARCSREAEQRYKAAR